MDHSAPVRRCFLAVPAINARMVEKAKSIKVDALFLDLEDSVPAAQRAEARENLDAELSGLDKGGRGFVTPHLAIRINEVSSEDFVKDIELLKSGVGRVIDSVILPKVNAITDLEKLETELLLVEKSLGLPDGVIAVDAQIETALGLRNADVIAAHPRVISLSFGPLDFLADLLIPTTDPESAPIDLINYALIKILISARAAGISVFDGPTVEYKDLDALAIKSQRAVRLGVDGKWAIHPNQIETITDVFSPSPETYQEAADLLAAFADNKAGAFTYNGVMVDAATLRMAQHIVGRSEK